MKKHFPFVSLLLMAGIVALLFFFSGQDSEHSGGLSLKVAQWLYKLFSLERWLALTAFHSFVRKLAHFTLFTVFGFGAAGLASYYYNEPLCRLGIVLILGSILAGSDEIHQLFSAGRCGCVPDVLLDTSGAAFGFLVRCFFDWLCHTIKNKMQS